MANRFLRKARRENRMRPHLVAFLMLGLLLPAKAADAELFSAELRVNGLSCPFCAFGIEKKLLGVPGVREVEVFLDEGRIALRFEPDNAATVSELEKAVEKAGFKLAAVSLEVGGELLEEGSVRLVVHPRMTLRLLEAHGSGTRPVSGDRLRRLRQSSALGEGSLVLTGAVEAIGASEPTLVLDGEEPAEGPTR